MFLVNQLVGFGAAEVAASGGAYNANAVNFDGTTGYLTRGGGLTGISDGKQCLLSFWHKAGVEDANNKRILYGEATSGVINRFRVYITSERLTAIANNSSGTQILNVTSSVDVFEIADGWVHCALSFDLTSTSLRHLYINGVADAGATWGTYTNDTIDYTLSDWSVGATPLGATKITGDLCDLYFHPTYLDLSVASTLQKFRKTIGKPENLGSDGSTPTGSQPVVFFSGATGSWHTNKGSGGGFTLNGTISTASSSPSD